MKQNRTVGWFTHSFQANEPASRSTSTLARDLLLCKEVLSIV
jgi:hypothetical protein